jgi:hypothetical protein
VKGQEKFGARGKFRRPCPFEEISSVVDIIQIIRRCGHAQEWFKNEDKD